MKFKTLFILLLATAIIGLLTNCKKYPENDLWFKSPESAISSGYLKGFTVDGVDSLSMFNDILNNPPYGGFPQHTDLWDITAFFWRFDKEGINSSFGSGSFHLFNNKKELYIYFNMYDGLNGLPVNYNIFYTNESNWKILKLTKSGTMRIQRTYNGKVYEMEFN